MKQLIAALSLVLMLVPASAEAKPKKKQTTPRLSTIEIIEKVNNHWQQNNKPEVRAFWDDAAYHTGNMEAYKLLGKAQWLEYSDKWARHNTWKGARGDNWAGWLNNYRTYGEGQNHVLFADWQICFQTYLDLYEMNPDEYKIARTKEVIDYQCAVGNTDFWWWADALYMAMPVFTKLYKQTGNTAYLDKLFRCFQYADSLMWDKEDQLYFRDGKYIYPKHKTEAGLKDFWARGNGWVLAGLAKVLQDMPAESPYRPLFAGRFCQLAEAVAKSQQKDGYWTRSMLDPQQSEGPETSGTAFFCYGLLWGMNNGLLDQATYAPVAQKAWGYLATKALQADGSVGYVQPIGEKAIKGQQLTAQNTANFGVGAFLLAACEKLRFDEKGTAEFTFEVRNDAEAFRQEVVELDAAAVYKKLGISGGRQFRVINAVHQEVPYQLTYDGKILVEVSVRPCGTAAFTIKRGMPRTTVNVAYGRMYPERVDDIAWENDRGAYRCYGPALQKKGERAFGNDVWTKNTPDLEVEKRYFVEISNHERIQQLRQAGQKAAADSLEELTTYHYDHGYGLDCYKVGPSLGCGTPALMDGDNIVFPYCWKEYELLDNGPLRFTVRMVYHPVEHKGGQLVEHRVLSLDKGSNFNKMTVWYEGGGKAVDVASGVVIHNEDTKSVVLGKNYVLYADPTDNPEGQNSQIYVAALFPYGAVDTRKIDNAGGANGIAGHALGIRRGVQPGEKFVYYFGSAWSKYDCRSLNEWQQRVDGFVQAQHHPLDIEIK